MKRIRIKKNILKFLCGIFAVLFFVCLKPAIVTASDNDFVNALSLYALQNGSSLMVVSKDPVPGYFSCIGDAVSVSSDGDIILVMPGEYEESLDTRGRDIMIIGADRSSVIIRYNTADYMTPVINASAGIFSNLTLIGYRESDAPVKPAAGAHAVTPDSVNDYFSGYAIHIDDDSEAGHSIIFNNCSIVSENSNCIGLGLRNHFTAGFYNCTLRSTGIAGIIYVHDADNLTFSGTDMHLVFSDNIWESYGNPYAIFATSINPFDRVELTFKNVTAYCYATNIAELYSPGNAYTGEDVRNLIAYPCSGPCTPVYGKEGRFSTVMSEMRKQTPIETPGICYIYDSSFSEDKASAAGITAVYPVYIRNPFDIPGNGWAGSASYYLTPDSCGNTLDVMNYRCVCTAMPFVQSDNMNGN